MIINPSKPPFDNIDLRRAMAFSLDRKAFIDIITDGQGDIGGVMLPAPEGVWGMPPEVLQTLPGYDPDVAKNRAEARKIMEGSVMDPINGWRRSCRLEISRAGATRQFC
jgi:peptide/nickel transport system substrate-binding protein